MKEIAGATLAWIHDALGPSARVLDITPVAPASHTNHRIRARTAAGAEVEFLLRLYTNAERLASDPWYDPAAEVGALRSLEGSTVPCPDLVADDVAAVLCEVPTLLLTWVPGLPPPITDVDVPRFVRELASPLRAVHGVWDTASMRQYEPYFVSDGLEIGGFRPPRWAGDPKTWERAFEAVAADPPSGPTRFIHRDYHHGNTVWRGNRLAGIVDWTTACAGPPGVDLSHARINLAWDLDLAAADMFLRAWRKTSGEPGVYHPYWDLLDAVDWLGDGTADPDDDPVALERYEAFVAAALAELG